MDISDRESDLSKMTLEDRINFQANDLLWVTSVANFQSLMKVCSIYMAESGKANDVLYKLEQKYGVKRTDVPAPKDDKPMVSKAKK